MTDTYSSILDVAKSLFIKQGYTATSMRQVAESAGIGKATIYHHFPDKQAILMKLVEGNVGQMQDALQSIGAELDPHRRIEVAAEVSIRFLYDSADLLQVARREVPGVREHLLSNFVSFYQSYTDLLEDAFRRGIEDKVFRPVNPRDAAQVFMNMIQGSFAFVYLTGARTETPEKAAARLLEIFFNGVNA